MEAELNLPKPACECDADTLNRLSQALRDKERELVERKRFDEELYSLVQQPSFSRCRFELTA